MNKISSGYIIIPIMFNVVNRPVCCSQNPEHTNAVLLVKGGAEIMIGCSDCISTDEFTKRVFELSGFVLPKVI